MVLPTAPTAYTTAQVLANPIELNSRLGTYTNFVNLLDLCGLALPAAIRPDGIPFGITLLAPAGQDAQLASIGRVFHADTGLTLGARSVAAAAACRHCSRRRAATKSPSRWSAPICRGMALNGELQTLGGRLLEATQTAPDYQLYALDTTPPKPGMLRVEAGAGSSIAARDLGAAGGRRSDNSSPRSRRRCRSAPCACRWPRREGLHRRADRIDGARDISAFGGWRAFVAEGGDVSLMVRSALRRLRT